MIALEVYAEAFFRANKDPLVGYAQLKDFSQIVVKGMDIFTSINGNSKAYETFRDLIETQFTREFSNLLAVLIQDARIDEWDRFLSIYRDILVDKALIHDVHVMSARPLKNDEVENLESRIIAKYGQYCEFRYDVDPSLIDGVKMVINHQTIDATIRGSLDKIKKEVLR